MAKDEIKIINTEQANQIDPEFFQDPEIFVKISGVGFKIFFIVELCRIDKNTHHRMRIFFE